MKYWLFLTNKENWELIKKFNIYAILKSNKNIANTISLGDKCILYVIPMQFGGAFKIISINLKNKVSFPNETMYDRQIRLSPELIPKNTLEVTKYNKKKIIEHISIFKGKNRWGTVLMGRSIIQITKEDYNFILDEMRSHV